MGGLKSDKTVRSSLVLNPPAMFLLPSYRRLGMGVFQIFGRPPNEAHILKGPLPHDLLTVLFITSPTTPGLLKCNI